MTKSLFSLAVAAGVSLAALATASAQTGPTVNYTFNRSNALLTSGQYFSGGMSVTFPTSPRTGVNYSIINSGSLSVINPDGSVAFSNTSLQTASTRYYTNVTNCGSSINVYETQVGSGANRAYLDYIPRYNVLLPGSTGTYTSWNDATGTYRLAVGCDYLARSLVNMRAAVVRTMMIQATSRASMFFMGVQNRINQVRFNSNRFFRKFFGAGDEDAGSSFAPWIQPIGSWARQSDHGGATPYTSNSGGFAVGIDGNYSENLILGGSFTFLRTNTDINVELPASTNSDTYNFSLYGRYSITPEWGATAMVAYGYTANKNKRAIDTSISGFATSSNGTNVLSGKIGVERDFGLINNLVFTPSIGLAGYYVNNAGFTENGDENGIIAQGKSSNTVTADANLRAMYKVTDAVGLMANVGASYDIVQGSVTVTAAPIASPTTFVAVSGEKLPPWAFQAGAGVLFNVTKQTTLGAQYGVELRSGYQNNAGSLSLRVAF